MRDTIHRNKLTPREVAERYGISTDKVLAWIRSGELRAINIATNPCGRPRYAIDEADLLAFEQQRQMSPPIRKTLHKRRKRNEGVIEFF